MTTELDKPHDHFFRSVFGQPELAADFFKAFLPAEMLAGLDFDALPEPLKDTFLDDELRAHFSDLLFRVRLKSGRAAYICILLEHKSAPEKDAAFQVLRYEVRRWEMAGRDAGGRFTPILPVVFYHGPKPWTPPCNFSSLVNLDDCPWMRPYTPEFDYLLVDLSTCDESAWARCHEFVQTALAALRHVFRDELDELLPEIIAPASRVSGRKGVEFIKTALRYLVQASPKVTAPGVTRAVRQRLPQEGEEVMETLATQWMREGQEIGVQLGLQEGLQQGLQQGRQEEAMSLILRQLQRRFDQLTRAAEEKIRRLSLMQLEQLGEELLDFQSRKDLTAWLRRQSAKK